MILSYNRSKKILIRKLIIPVISLLILEYLTTVEPTYGLQLSRNNVDQDQVMSRE